MRARWWLVLGALLATTVVLVYAPVAHHRFINYDDPTYVTENPAVQHGLTPAALWWGLTAFHGANWHPLTWWSHTLDVQLLGPDAGRHLLESVALHVVYPPNRHLSNKVRVFVDWVADLFENHDLVQLKSTFPRRAA